MELNKIYNEDCVLGMKKLSDNSIFKIDGLAHFCEHMLFLGT